MPMLLDVRDLHVQIPTTAGAVHAVNGVSLIVGGGEIVGIVGESGSGKSMTALALMRLQPGNARVSGSIEFDGRDLLALPPGDMARIRGAAMSIIFQDPLSYLNPVMRIGEQIIEAIRIHEPHALQTARQRALNLLQKVGIASPPRVFDAYPHELSGGMRQRVLIAMAIILRPKLLIADEPTTALDVTIQAQIMSLLVSLCREIGAGLILITHDLGLIAEYCSRAYVMYAGRIVEGATVDQLFYEPRHPYMQALLGSILSIDRKSDTFQAIEGSVPQLINVPPGCLFRSRCTQAVDQCGREVPPTRMAAEGHTVACWRHEQGAAS